MTLKDYVTNSGLLVGSKADFEIMTRSIQLREKTQSFNLKFWEWSPQELTEFRTQVAAGGIRGSTFGFVDPHKKETWLTKKLPEPLTPGGRIGETVGEVAGTTIPFLGISALVEPLGAISILQEHPLVSSMLRSGVSLGGYQAVRSIPEELPIAEKLKNVGVSAGIGAALGAGMYGLEYAGQRYAAWKLSKETGNFLDNVGFKEAPTATEKVFGVKLPRYNDEQLDRLVPKITARGQKVVMEAIRNPSFKFRPKDMAYMAESIKDSPKHIATAVDYAFTYEDVIPEAHGFVKAASERYARQNRIIDKQLYKLYKRYNIAPGSLSAKKISLYRERFYLRHEARLLGREMANKSGLAGQEWRTMVSKVETEYLKKIGFEDIMQGSLDPALAVGLEHDLIGSTHGVTPQVLDKIIKLRGKEALNKAYQAGEFHDPEIIRYFISKNILPKTLEKDLPIAKHYLIANEQKLANEIGSIYNRIGQEGVAKGWWSEKTLKTYQRLGYTHHIFNKGYMAHLSKSDMTLDLPIEAMKRASATYTRKGAETGRVRDALMELETYLKGLSKYENLYPVIKSVGKFKYSTALQNDGLKAYLNDMKGAPNWLTAGIKDILDGTVLNLHQAAKAAPKEYQNIYKHLLPAAEGMINAAETGGGAVANNAVRAYYFMKIGFAADTAMKNSIQWRFIIPRYGGKKGFMEGFFRAFSKDGDAVVKQAGVMEEALKRGKVLATVDSNWGRAQKLVDNIEKYAYMPWSGFDTLNRRIASNVAYACERAAGRSPRAAIGMARAASHQTQFSYTKADELVMDSFLPPLRYVLFKRWPLMKIKMLKNWTEAGHPEAAIAQVVMDVACAVAASKMGFNMWNWFFNEYNLVSRGPTVPFGQELAWAKDAFKDDDSGDYARYKLRKEFNSLGIRYLEKTEDFYTNIMNDYALYDYKGNKTRDITQWENIKALLVYPQEAADYREAMGEISDFDRKAQREANKITLLYKKAIDNKDTSLLREVRYKINEYQLTYGKKMDLPTRYKNLVRRQTVGKLETRLKGKNRLKETIKEKYPSLFK